MGRLSQMVSEGIRRMPDVWRADVLKLRSRWLMARGRFVPNEIEQELVPALLAPGDWVLDIGANVGHYTRIFSDCVGPAGRVIACEPVRATFAVLASNVAAFPHRNVTLFNVAVSDVTGEVAIEVPEYRGGTGNEFRARVSPEGDGAFRAFALRLDTLELPRRVALVKVDVEGHEAAVLRSLAGLVARDRPVLVVEAAEDGEDALMRGWGYTVTRTPGSYNWVGMPPRG